MACGQHQIEAARQDHRVIVLPPLFDRSPLPDAVVAAYGYLQATGKLTATAVSAKPAIHELAAQWFRTQILRKPPVVKPLISHTQNPDLATLLSRLAEIEPRFGHEMRVL